MNQTMGVGVPAVVVIVVTVNMGSVVRMGVLDATVAMTIALQRLVAEESVIGHANEATPAVATLMSSLLEGTLMTSATMVT